MADKSKHGVAPGGYFPPAAADSLATLVQTTGGRLFSIARLQPRNAVILETGGTLYVYTRIGDGPGNPGKAYQTGNLKRHLAPGDVTGSRDLDHVASRKMEAQRIGSRWGLIALTDKRANRSAGATNERNVSALRAFDKAARGDGTSRVIGTMHTKLSGQPATGAGRQLAPPAPSDPAAIAAALMQDPQQQQRLRKLQGAEIRVAPPPSVANAIKLDKPLSTPAKRSLSSTTAQAPVVPTSPKPASPPVSAPEKATLARQTVATSAAQPKAAAPKPPAPTIRAGGG